MGCGESRVEDSEVDREGEGATVNAWLTRRMRLYLWASRSRRRDVTPITHVRGRITYHPRIRPACTPASLRFQERVEGLDHVDRSMNECHVDDSDETVMVDGVRDDP